MFVLLLLASSGCSPDNFYSLLCSTPSYLIDAPRRVPAMILAPGNRADVALRCDIETEPGVYKMKSVSRGRYFAPINPNAEDQYEQADPNVSRV